MNLAGPLVRALCRMIFATILLTAGLSDSAHAQGGPPYRTDDPETSGNKHWEINFGFIGARNPASGSYQFQSIAATNNQPSWIAYVGLQVELAPKDHTAP
jgi:hypothetical protein